MKAIVDFLVALLTYTFNFQSFITFMFALLAAFLLLGLALIWIARRWKPAHCILIGLVVLVSLLIPAPLYAKIFPPSGVEPYETNLAFTLFLIASVAIITSGLLLSSGWKFYKERGPAQSAKIDVLQPNRLLVLQPAFILLLGIIITLKALDNIYWATVWDNTTDPLGFFWLFTPILAAILAGGLLSIILTARMKTAGLAFTVLVPVLLIAVSASAQRVDNHALTKARAEQVAQAIESYRTRVGRYPQTLSQLSPRYIFPLPEPVIIFGQHWCYDGGQDYYRLGYIDRQHWSDPRLIGRIHKTAGVLPDLDPICTQEAAPLEARDPSNLYSYWKEAND